MKITHIQNCFLLLSLVGILSCNKEPLQPALEPIASFTIQNNNCTASCAVIFTNTSANYNSSVWNFGDNTNSMQTSPSKTYTKPGSYTVSLTVTGSSGTNAISQVITIGSGIPTKQWDKTLGGNDFDDLYVIVSTADGGLLWAGSSYSDANGDKSNDHKGYPSYWIIKTNSAGIKQWDKTFGGNAADVLTSALATADGGFLLGGYSYSSASGDKSENRRGLRINADYWVIKINATGVKQWDKTFGGSATDKLTSVINTPDGGFLLSGLSNSDANGDKLENSKGATDYWLLKIDGNGNKQWDKTLGGSSDDIPASAISVANGGFLVVGYSSSSTGSDKSENTRGFIDYWVVKISNDGTRQWDKTFGGYGGDYLSSVVTASDGGFLLGGYSYSAAGGDKSENLKGDNDYWVVKITGSGNKQWDKTLGSEGDDHLRSVVATPDRGFLLAGYSLSNTTSGDKSENGKGNNDYWIIKIDGSGTKQWDKTFGAISDEYLYTLLPTTDGGFLLAGSSLSDIDGDKSEDSRGLSDYWVVKIR